VRARLRALAFAFAAAAATVAGPVPANQIPGPTTDPVAAFALSGPAEQGALLRGTAPPATARLLLDGKPVPLAADGSFIIGFDRDSPASAILVAERADGSSLTATLAVQPHDWAIEHIDALSRPTAPDPEYMKVRAVEVARIAAARVQDSASDGWRQHFIAPAHGRFSGLFGAQRIYRGGVPAAFHSGLDIAAGAGATVVAPADGIVVLAGPPIFSLEGNLVIIDHGMGLNSAFLHLSTTAVHVGQVVKQGDVIGTVGATGRATGPHLHWSVKWRDARIDPQRLLQD